MIRARRVFSRRPRRYGQRSVIYKGRDSSGSNYGGGGEDPRSADGVENEHGQPAYEGHQNEHDQSERTVAGLPGSPLIVVRQDHCISRKNIDPDALKILYRLSRFGYQAFLVGGAVRDLLLGKTPKDYDISTSATPREVKSIFRNSRMIGRRFRIIHVFFQNNKIMEVSTLRATSSEEEIEEPGLVKEDNTYGDAESDARRRDITINGLFYDPVNFTVIDYVGGLEDLRARTVRVIGDPSVRFKEDPVRMIRAIRHAARADFSICPQTYQAICENKELISLCAKPRVYEELLREFRGSASLKSVELLFQTGLLEFLFPALHQSLNRDGEHIWPRLRGILSRFDDLAKDQVELPPSLIFLALTIGNFRPGMLLDNYSTMTCEAEETIWADVPNLTSYGDLVGETAEKVTSVDTDGHGPTAMSPSSHPSRPRRGRRNWRRHRDQDETPSEDDRILRRGIPSVTEVGKMVHQVFTPIGVSRREQERMVRMLLGRYELFALWKQAAEQSSHPESGHGESRAQTERGSAVIDFLKRAHFNDSLQLLELTGLEPEATSCSDFWLDRLNKYYRKKKSRQ